MPRINTKNNIHVCDNPHIRIDRRHPERDEGLVYRCMFGACRVVYPVLEWYAGKTYKSHIYDPDAPYRDSPKNMMVQHILNRPLDIWDSGISFFEYDDAGHFQENLANIISDIQIIKIPNKPRTPMRIFENINKGHVRFRDQDIFMFTGIAEEFVEWAEDRLPSSTFHATFSHNENEVMCYPEKNLSTLIKLRWWK